MEFPFVISLIIKKKNLFLALQKVKPYFESKQNEFLDKIVKNKNRGKYTNYLNFILILLSLNST